MTKAIWRKVYDTYKARMAALLPTASSINPQNPVINEYFDNGDALYIVQRQEYGRTGTFRVLGSSGDLGKDWAIGTKHEIKHDQTWRYMGTFEVVGILFTNGGIRAPKGLIPNRKLPYWVFK